MCQHGLKAGLTDVELLHIHTEGPGDKVCQWLTTGQWLSPGTLVSSIKKTDCHNITEILLKAKPKLS
jgi:hypothetical protein